MSAERQANAVASYFWHVNTRRADSGGGGGGRRVGPGRHDV